MASSKNTKLVVGGLVAAATVGAIALLFSSEANAEEPFIPEEEDDPPTDDPAAAEEIPEDDVVEDIKKETGVDVGAEGWTPEKINTFLGTLGYTGSAGARIRQFQRDSRVNPMKSLLLNGVAHPVATDLTSGMSRVDGDIGPKTIEQLNRTGILLVVGKWNKSMLFIGGTPPFFESLVKLGYNVTKTPEVATRAFQRDAKAQLNIPSMRLDGNVDSGTIGALVGALMKNSTGNWVASE